MSPDFIISSHSTFCLKNLIYLLHYFTKSQTMLRQRKMFFNKLVKKFLYIFYTKQLFLNIYFIIIIIFLTYFSKIIINLLSLINSTQLGRLLCVDLLNKRNARESVPFTRKNDRESANQPSIYER